jgi:hypothetical protein
MFKKVLIVLSFAVATASCIGYAKDITTSPEQKFLKDIHNNTSEYNTINDELALSYAYSLCDDLDRKPVYDTLVTFHWDHQDLNINIASVIAASAVYNLCPSYWSEVKSIMQNYSKA